VKPAARRIACWIALAGLAVVVGGAESSLPTVTRNGFPAQMFAVGQHVRLEARLVPFDLVALNRQPPPLHGLPQADDCRSGLAAMSSFGDVGRAGKLELSLAASRTTQVTIKRLHPRVVVDSQPSRRSVAVCSSSDWRERYVRRPDQLGFDEEIDIGGLGYVVPVINPKDPLDGRHASMFERSVEPSWLEEDPKVVQPEAPLNLAMYLINTDVSGRWGLILDATLTVNGIDHNFIVSAPNGEPFWIYGVPPAGWRSREYEWLSDRRSWVSDRPFDRATAAPPSVPENRLCQVVGVDQLAAELGEPIVAAVDHDEQGCRWINLDTGASFWLGAKTFASREEAVKEFNRGLRTRNREISGFGDRAVSYNNTIVAYQESMLITFSFNLPKGGSAAAALNHVLPAIDSALGWKR
jgi:hypothetical protein